MKNDLMERLMNFSIDVIECSKLLGDIDRNVKSQLIRAATSCAANYNESQFGCSKGDFIHKLHLSLKELAETCYWLLVIQKVNSFKDKRIEERIAGIMSESEELKKILSTCILKAKQNLKKEKQVINK